MSTQSTRRAYVQKCDCTVYDPPTVGCVGISILRITMSAMTAAGGVLMVCVVTVGLYMTSVQYHNEGRANDIIHDTYSTTKVEVARAEARGVVLARASGYDVVRLSHDYGLEVYARQNTSFSGQNTSSSSDARLGACLALYSKYNNRTTATKLCAATNTNVPITLTLPATAGADGQALRRGTGTGGGLEWFTPTTDTLPSVAYVGTESDTLSTVTVRGDTGSRVCMSIATPEAVVCLHHQNDVLDVEYDLQGGGSTTKVRIAMNGADNVTRLYVPVSAGIASPIKQVFVSALSLMAADVTYYNVTATDSIDPVDYPCGAIVATTAGDVTSIIAHIYRDSGHWMLAAEAGLATNADFLLEFKTAFLCAPDSNVGWDV